MDADADGLASPLRAGIAVYNAGAYHAAHDAWEARWLDLPPGADERLLHGLIQFTAAVHHATTDNPEGAEILADSARGYLGDLPADYRDVNVGPAREWLARLAADPGLPGREGALPLSHEGRVVGLEDLAPPAAAVAAGVLDGDDGAAVVDERVLARLRRAASGGGDDE